MSAESSRAVFLSYASQDAEAAQRVCEALRAAGIEVWFDQSELVGGDAWDQKIRRQIKECALFVPIISANTQARREGYFRLEWKLADDRTHLMARGTPFLVPVCIDDTKDWDALVPDSFTSVQWIRWPGGATSTAFCERVKTLLRGAEWVPRDIPRVDVAQSNPHPALQARAAKSRVGWLSVALAAVVAAVGLSIWQPWKKTPPSAPTSIAPNTEARKLILQARALIDDDWLAGRENFRLAEELCERAVKLAPDDGEAWATAARVSMETIRRRYDITSGREAVARSQVERAIRLAPDSIEAGLAMAAHLSETRNSATAAFFTARSSAADEEAERRLRDLHVRAPQDARVLLMLARVLNYTSVGKDGEASEIRLHHRVFAGRDPRPLADEADALHLRGRFAEAEALVDRAQALAPTLDGYYTKLVLMTRYVRDAEATRRFIETLPTQVLLEDAFASRVAWFYIRQGEGTSALRHLRRVPRDFFEEKQQVLPKGFQTGWAQKINGRLTAAQAEWKQALSVVEKRILAEPNQAELVSWKALLLVLTDQKDEAEKVWKLAGELVGRPAGQEGFTTAEFHLAVGRHEEAIRALQSVRRFQISDRTLENRSSLLYDPWWEPIRNDPAVHKLIREVEALYQQLWQSGGKPAAKSASTGEVK
jgi:tetratricopeptide (TPR) repeat protein